MKPGRYDVIARAVTLGKARSEIVQDDEEGRYWDDLLREVAVIRETGGIVELAWDNAGTPEDHLQHLYREDELT